MGRVGTEGLLCVCLLQTVYVIRNIEANKWLMLCVRCMTSTPGPWLLLLCHSLSCCRLCFETADAPPPPPPHVTHPSLLFPSLERGKDAFCIPPCEKLPPWRRKGGKSRVGKAAPKRQRQQRFRAHTHQHPSLFYVPGLSPLSLLTHSAPLSMA